MLEHTTQRFTGSSERAMYVGISVAVLGYVLGAVIGHQFDEPGEWANAVLGLKLAMVPTLLAAYYVMLKK